MFLPFLDSIFSQFGVKVNTSNVNFCMLLTRQQVHAYPPVITRLDEEPQHPPDTNNFIV